MLMLHVHAQMKSASSGHNARMDLDQPQVHWTNWQGDIPAGQLAAAVTAACTGGLSC